MAGTKSNYLENIIINTVLRNTTYSQVATVYVALYTSDPTDADSGTEVSGGSYARVSCAFDAASGGATANTSTLTFPTATGSWGTITHFGVRDASTGGNLLYHGDLTVPKTVTSGDVVIFSAGELDITES